MKKFAMLFLSTFIVLVLAACNNTGDTNTDEETSDNNDTEATDLGEENINLSYVEWDSEIASTHVMQLVLEQAGYNVEITPLDNAVMWESVAQGDSDAMVSAWLPLTHGNLFEEYEDSFEDLGPNLEGAKIGLVVPTYMEVDSIEGLSDEAGSTITGIEPGAGVVQAAENALETYSNLDNWDVQTSSSGAMASELGSKINNEEDIIVTGWTPHWKFQSYDLKYLEDPEGVFGDEETINTIVREGLSEDSPKAYNVLDQFFWETSDMESVMLEIEEGASPEEAAQNWIDNNQDKVDEWLNN